MRWRSNQRKRNQPSSPTLHENGATSRRSGESLARRAVALDGADPEALSCLSRALLWHGDFSGSLNEAERALDISPNSASAHGQLGQTLIHLGRPREGVAALN